MNKVERQDGDTEPANLDAAIDKVAAVASFLVGYGDVAEIAAKRLREALRDFDNLRAAEPERPAPSPAVVTPLREVAERMIAWDQMNPPMTGDHAFWKRELIAALAASAPVVDNGANLGHSTGRSAVSQQPLLLNALSALLYAVTCSASAVREGATRDDKRESGEAFELAEKAIFALAASAPVDDNAAVHREEAPLKSTESDLAARQVDAPLTALREALQTYVDYDVYINGPDGGPKGDPAFDRVSRARAALAAAPPRPPDVLDHVECQNCGNWFYCEACGGVEPELHFRHPIEHLPGSSKTPDDSGTEEPA